MDKQLLKEERNHLLRTAEDIAEKVKSEGRTITDEELAQTNDLMSRAKKIDDQIADIVRTEAQLELIASRQASIKKEDASRKTVASGTTDRPSETRIEVERPYRVKELRAFTGERRSADERAYRSGMWALATILGNPTARAYCADNNINMRATLESVNTQGGWLVPDEFSAAIIDLREQYGVFRQNARVVAMGRDVMYVPRKTGGLTAYTVGEGVTITESNVAGNVVQLVAKKLGVFTSFSREWDADAVINVADDLATDIGMAFAEWEDTVGFAGQGTAAHYGIRGFTKQIEDLGITYYCAPEAVATHDTFGEIDSTDLGYCMANVQPRALRNAKWYCSSVCKAALFDRLLGAAGGNTMINLAGMPQASYMGYPIVVTQALPVSTASLDGKAMLLFGDITMASKMGDRRGIEISRSDEYKFPEDLICLKGVERIDINIHDLGGLIATGATALAPVVGLIGNVS